MTPLRIAALVLVLGLAAGTADAQSNAPSAAAPNGPMPMHHATGGPMMPGTGQPAGVPTQPGQAAFGAIQEIVGELQADPRTDWSRVDIDALRQHLIDMDEVTMRAAAQKEPLENGLRIAVTGEGRTLEAIRRMVPSHAHEIDGLYGWTVRTDALPNGAVLLVTAGNPADVQKIRGLGFMGIMVLGQHHQVHHLAISRGEPPHLP